MTLGLVLLLMGLGAIAVASGTAVRRVSPWWIVAAACVPGALVVAVAGSAVDEPCQGGASLDWVDGVFELAVVLSLTLYAAAALAGVIDAVRRVKAGAYGAALARFAVFPLVSVLAAGAVFYAFIAAVFHCWE